MQAGRLRVTGTYYHENAGHEYLPDFDQLDDEGYFVVRAIDDNPYKDDQGYKEQYSLLGTYEVDNFLGHRLAVSAFVQEQTSELCRPFVLPAHSVAGAAALPRHRGIAVFSYELDWLLNPALRASPDSTSLDWTAIKEKAEAAFPGSNIFQIAEPLAPGYAAEVVLVYGEDFNFWHAFADPATGAIVGDPSYFNIQRFFRSFHMNLFFIGRNFNLGFWAFALSSLSRSC